MCESASIERFVLRPYQNECIERYIEFYKNINDKEVEFYNIDINDDSCSETINDSGSETIDIVPSDEESDSSNHDDSSESNSIETNINSAIIQLACGSGKTLILYHIAINTCQINNRDTVVILCVPSLQLLSQIFMNWMLYHYYDNTIDIESMIVGSSIDITVSADNSGLDCTTDIDVMIDRLNSFKFAEKSSTRKRLIVLFTTYQSSSILKSAIATIEKDFVVAKLGKLEPIDIQNLNIMIDTIC